MKLLIEKKVLLESLNYVSRALSTKNIIPVLNGIKFDLTKEGLSLMATDNDITIKSVIKKEDIKKIDEEGCSVIYGKSLLEIIKKLPDTDILIENFEDNKISFSTESSVYNFNCFLKEDFPNINLDTKEDFIKISSNEFKDMINKTVFACSMQESRPLLTGVNIKVTGNILECTATDSYRLSKIIKILDIPANENINIVIPSRNINEFIKTIENNEDLEIHTFSDEKILFKYENLLFQSSLLKGEYPNTDRSIPNEFKYKIKLKLKEYYNILDRASLISQSKDKNIVDFEIIGNKLIVKASSIEMGKVEETMNVENETDNNIRISFSAKYMLDALRILNTDEIYVLLNGEISPIILKEIDNDNLIELILPMKTF